MRIRDALESDAERLAELVGRPPDILVNMVHDRSVRVAVRDPTEPGENESDEETSDLDDGRRTSDASGGRDASGDRDGVDDPGDTDGSIVGFVAFDARGDTVHVTHFAAPGSAAGRLFEEPKRFARREAMDVEVVVADEERDRIAAVEDAGFVAVGSGPRFENRKTTRFRFETNGE
ncbi:MAG: hypothetical protein A07HR67_00642 [uncultured archaeon A07HR67]|nr:MAG: hypothetical protein A07HR67_00642 [uncultured archaeon A07HR67]